LWQAILGLAVALERLARVTEETSEIMEENNVKVKSVPVPTGTKK
jgi:hypothetical protein